MHLQQFFWGYFGWAALGFVTGFHWLCFLPLTCCSGVTSFVYIRQRTVLAHVLSYWVANGLFWAVRQTMLPWYVKCSGGESMSVSCLFKEQEARYQAFYVIHLLLLLFFLLKWIAEGFVLWYLVRKAQMAASVTPEAKQDPWVEDKQVLPHAGENSY